MAFKRWTFIILAGAMLGLCLFEVQNGRYGWAAAALAVALLDLWCARLYTDRKE